MTYVSALLLTATMAFVETTSRFQAHDADQIDGSALNVDVVTAARVRSGDARILDLIREGNEQSGTFRKITDKIGQSNGIVYVEFGYCAFGHLNGCLLPVIASSPGVRYLRAIVTPDKTRRSHAQLLALIAHELQHALEVFEHPEVSDMRSMEAMFRRIGSPEKNGMTGYETSAARASGDAVLADLSVKRR
jgi:hypothetical protein